MDLPPRHAPPLAPGEQVQYWGPVKYRSEHTDGHPFGRASGIAVLTNKVLWYRGTVTSVGIPLERVVNVRYNEHRRSGVLSVTSAKDSAQKVHEFFEGRRYMRRLLQELRELGDLYGWADR